MTQTSEATAPAAADTSSAATKKSGGLSSMLLPELKRLASSLGIKGTGSMRKSALVDAISAARADSSNNGTSQHADPATGRTVPPETAAGEQSLPSELDVSSSSADPTSAPFRAMR